MHLHAARLAIALSAALASSAAAQDPLFKILHHELFNAQLVIISGDVDNDGALDLMTRGSVGTVLYTGHGDGTFDEVAVPPGIFGGHDDALADLDADGHLDVISALGPNIRVTLGHGDGTFGPTQTYPTTEDCDGITVADLDADGHLDVAVGNREDVRFSVLLGHGDGTFEPRKNYGPAGLAPRDTAAGDFDGDTFPDLVLAPYQGTAATVFLNDGAGGFPGPPLALPTGILQSVAAADMDEDGLDDVLVSAQGMVHYLPADGLGGFGPRLDIPLSFVGRRLITPDLDEDGHLDIVATSGFSDFVFIRGHGDGTFDAPRFAGAGPTPFDVTAGDWNLDGETDLAFVDFASDGVTIVLHRGDLVFGPHHAVGDGPRGIALADLDGDGVLDLVTANHLGGDVAVCPGLGDGWFGARRSIAAPVANIAEVLAVDVVGDAALDLVIANVGLSGGKVAVLPGDGDLTFGAPIISSGGNDLSDLAADDLDGDGELDLVCASTGLNAVVVFLGAGDGTFSATTYPGGLAPRGVTLGDFTGDALPDVAVANDVGPGRIQLLANTGGGAFAAPVQVPAPGGTHRIASADLDGDGALDVVTAGAFSAAVGVLLGHGDGTFEPFVELPAGATNPLGVRLGDVDGDGALDIVTANQHLFFDEGGVGVHLGHGDGTFEPPLEFPTSGDTQAVALGDVNGDGVLDVAAAVYGGRTVTILRSERGPWDDLGAALAGTHGLSHQTAEGTLAAFAPFRFTLSDALPGGSAYHVVGVSQLAAPFKGGVLVPHPDLLNGPLPIDGDGRLVLAGPWLDGVPPGLQLWLQFWFPDAGGPVGFAASNAVRATMP